jgi:hypothetical protein
MVIVVPEGDVENAIRKPEYYDETFEYFFGAWDKNGIKNNLDLSDIIIQPIKRKGYQE